MTFETIDWQAEARRVRAAFGIEAAGEFVETDENVKVLARTGGKHSIGLASVGSKDVELYCVYTRERGRFYTLFSGIASVDQIATYSCLTWDDMFYLEFEENDYTELLAQGLFHLNLLTPEVEAALQVSISAHQKMEWELEYQARVNGDL